jgi:hypothetical protein
MKPKIEILVCLGLILLFSGFVNAAPKIIIKLDDLSVKNGIYNPEFDFFVNNYNKSKDRFKDYMTLQGHPNQWSADKIDQFGKIVDFLISEGCEFVLPYEYCNIDKL